MTTTRLRGIVDQLRAEESDLQDKLDNAKQEAKLIETERRTRSSKKRRSGSLELMKMTRRMRMTSD